MNLRLSPLLVLALDQHPDWQHWHVIFCAEISGHNVYEFTLLSVGAIGKCITDTFSVTSPGGFGSPVICGTNTGYHSKFHWFCQNTARIFHFDFKWFWMPPLNVIKPSLTLAGQQPQQEVGTFEWPIMHVGMKLFLVSKWETITVLPSILWLQVLLGACNTTQQPATPFKSNYCNSIDSSDSSLCCFQFWTDSIIDNNHINRF